MRPIHLRFSGLQSYKEAQEVDFQRLTELGVFGIFGPTGSGKSTILDAITLALYGRVERAGGTIQGIMNTNSDKLNVSFAFSWRAPLPGGAGIPPQQKRRNFPDRGEAD